MYFEFCTAVHIKKIYITLFYKFSVVRLQNEIEEKTLQCHIMQVQGFTM